MMRLNEKVHVFHVNGMHCNACILLTESKLLEVDGVTSAKASLKSFSVEVTGDWGDKEAEHIARDLSAALIPHGYSLSVEKTPHSVAWRDFNTALPIALAIILFFLLLQKLQVVNLITGSKVGYGTAFIIGIIASISTCMAIVGGLVLSLSANFAKSGDGVRPQILFHIGRLISFFVLGGVVGALGASFQLGNTGTFVLSLVVVVVLLILGINLLDVFPFMKRFQFTMPSTIGTRVHGLKDVNHTLTPFLVGTATFFLPCGFTQSMQLYSLTTGSFMTGALTMSAFALGTFPVLSLLSFGAVGLRLAGAGSAAKAGVFFKTAGLVVIFFGVFNLANALAAQGIIPPLFSF